MWSIGLEAAAALSMPSPIYLLLGGKSRVKDAQHALKTNNKPRANQIADDGAR
jgi:hypothetical protein